MKIMIFLSIFIHISRTLLEYFLPLFNVLLVLEPFLIFLCILYSQLLSWIYFVFPWNFVKHFRNLFFKTRNAFFKYHSSPVLRLSLFVVLRQLFQVSLLEPWVLRQGMCRDHTPAWISSPVLTWPLVTGWTYAWCCDSFSLLK